MCLNYSFKIKLSSTYQYIIQQNLKIADIFVGQYGNVIRARGGE